MFEQRSSAPAPTPAPGKQASHAVVCSALWKALVLSLHSSLHVGSLFYFGLLFQGCRVLIKGQEALIVSYFSLGLKVLLWCWYLSFILMLIF